MGLPKTQGVDVSPYFTKEYYRREYPVWSMSDPVGIFGEVELQGPRWISILLFGLSIGLTLGFALWLIRLLVPYGSVEKSS